MKSRRGSGLRRRTDPDDLAREFADASAAYAESLPEKARALAAAIASARYKRDAEALSLARAIAHRLRGAAGSYGFADVSELGRIIEENLRLPFAKNAWTAIDGAMSELNASVLARTA